MEGTLDFCAKVANFKCFGEDPQGFDEIKPFNLIIGRNNSGKSTLIDLIDALTQDNPSFDRVKWHSQTEPTIVLESPLTEKELKRVFPPTTSGGVIPGSNHWQYAQNYLGKRFRCAYPKYSLSEYLFIEECSKATIPITKLHGTHKYIEQLAKAKVNPMKGMSFKRIIAERDIEPEADSSGNLFVHPNGRGATNIIQNFINKASLPSELVETTLLRELNKIFGPDAEFTDIVRQQYPTGHWEIYLEEKKKGRIPLSGSGSGIKTVVLVLVFLYLIPKVESKALSDYIFGIEELENNLHPSLLRRIIAYLYGQYQSSGCRIFLTTHSSVAIDQLSKNEDCQIIHVKHDGKAAKVRRVKTYIENQGVLDDLDIRASDLLQSNAIIWVEGPSDRIYVNTWIRLWAEGELTEGTQYQCVFYGGRLLSHLSADSPDTIQSALQILNVNRNSIILIDSDKRAKQTPLNRTKQRIVDEIEKQRSYAWVTKGREIENYIPQSVTIRLLDIATSQDVGQYDSFFDYLNELQPDKGNYYSAHKPQLAEQACALMVKDELNGVLDLAERLDDVCRTLRQWNFQNQT